MKYVTRRQVLGPIGIAACSSILSGCISKDIVSSTEQRGRHGSLWVYAKLNPDTIAQRAYYDCRKGRCMYGVFASVMSQLAERHGEPYRSFPVAMMRYGAGGVGGTGSLCGTLNGGAALIGLFAKSEEDMKLLVSELFLWYEQNKLPVFVPREPIFDIEVPASVSNSVLCHVSVTRWCEVSGYKAFGNPQEERCKRLAADTAKKTVEILNSYSEGRFKANHRLNEDVRKCMSCHAKTSEKQDTRGKLNCSSCHFSLACKHP